MEHCDQKEAPFITSCGRCLLFYNFKLSAAFVTSFSLWLYAAGFWRDLLNQRSSTIMKRKTCEREHRCCRRNASPANLPTSKKRTSTPGNCTALEKTALRKKRGVAHHKMHDSQVRWISTTRSQEMLDIATNGQVLAAERNGPIWVTKTELSPPRPPCSSVPKAREHNARVPKNPNNVVRTFFNRLHLIPKDLWFEHGGVKLVSCPGRHLNLGTPLPSWTRSSPQMR